MEERTTANSTGYFAHKLGHYLARSGYNTCQIARISGLPRRSIANWLEGIVQKPRSWKDILKLAQALRLNQPEVDELLALTDHPSLAQLQSHQPDQHLFTFWSAAASAAPPPFQAIPDLATFVGREEARQTLAAWLLTDSPHKVCTLEGMIGVGKTALAARLAYQLRPHFPDGVLWARLDTSDPFIILRQFAEAYGVDVAAYEDLDSRSQFVRGILAHKQALMVLDNVRSSRQIEALLPPSGACTVLITSRWRDLSLAQGVHRFSVEPFSAAESLALFSKVVGKKRVAQENALFSEMAHILGHLPLAVDIAACRLADEPHWTTAVFLAQLQSEKSQLDHLVHDERCLRTAFYASYDLLEPSQQQFLAAVSTFGGEDFSPEAAAAVANLSLAEAQAHLKTLFCLSLVHQGRANRFRLIPVVRTFAREKIVEETVWQRLTHYFEYFAAQHSQNKAALRLEWNNIAAAQVAA